MSITIDIPAITSFDDVLGELKALEAQLPRAGLDQLIAFNMAYTVITRGIKNAAHEGYFAKPIFIEKFTICFASYYFQAINDMVSKSTELPAAWAKLRDIRGSAPIFITLLMGANAHINHDLPLAMADFLKRNKDYSLRDARKVDHILMKSGKIIIPAFDESNY